VHKAHPPAQVKHCPKKESGYVPAMQVDIHEKA